MQDNRDTLERDERDQRDRDGRDDRDKQDAGRPSLTVEEAAIALGVTRRTICRWVEAEKLPGRRVRGKRGEELRIDRSAVMAFRLVMAPNVERDQRDDRDRDQQGERDTERDKRGNQDRDRRDERDGREVAALRERLAGARLAAKVAAQRMGEAHRQVEEERERRERDLRQAEERSAQRAAQLAGEVEFLRERLIRSEEQTRALQIMLGQVTQALNAVTERPALEAKNITPRRRWWRWWRRG